MEQEGVMKKRVAVKVLKRTLRAISPIGYLQNDPSYNSNTIGIAIRQVNKLKRRVKANDKQRVTTECACY